MQRRKERVKSTYRIYPHLQTFAACSEPKLLFCERHLVHCTMIPSVPLHQTLHYLSFLLNVSSVNTSMGARHKGHKPELEWLPYKHILPQSPHVTACPHPMNAVKKEYPWRKNICKNWQYKYFIVSKTKIQEHSPTSTSRSWQTTQRCEKFG